METSLAARSLYLQVPPDYESRSQINPTLMMSWWATIFSLVIIVVRLCGRYVRIERFFPEDKIMMISVLPLTIRMLLVHFILVWGTNNVQTTGLTPQEISHRRMGSKLVLAARIFYAIFIWTAKLTVCEFLKRVTGLVWRRSITIFLRFVHLFLASTLVAVVIATLAECQPFHHYWQVIPDPGPTCRAGYAQLITMGTCDVITDLLLIAFPVPIMLMSHMPVKRKFALVVLFCLSLLLVAITCYRVPSVIRHGGSQPYRSLIASLEILAATAVSNMVVISSFIRDRGVKKLKFKPDQGSTTVSEGVDDCVMRRNTVMQHQWGSDCDLAADLGMRLDPKLCSDCSSLRRTGTLPSAPVPAPPMPMAVAHAGSIDRRSSDDDHSLDIKVNPREYIPTTQSPRQKQPPPRPPSPLSARQLSFFDVGGLLTPDQPTSPISPTAHSPSPVDAVNPESQRSRRGNRAVLQDLRALSPRSPTSASSQPRLPSPVAAGGVAEPSSPTHTLPPYWASPDVSLDVDVELQDVGGLLSSQHPSPG